jgi:putative tryptophan/tyrosine transport system substrate-binding protein
MAIDTPRREFVFMLGSAAVAWPLAAHAQTPRKLPTIGLLIPGTRAAHGPWFDALVRRLTELGWADGRTVAIEYRYADGRSDRYDEIAAEFVRLKVDLIVTMGPAAQQARRATSVIPIVLPLSGDPVGVGLAASLARPGGNVTGLSIMQPELASKRLELLREIVPNIRRLAIMVNPGFRDVVLEANEVQAMAQSLGIEVATLDVWRGEEIMPALESLKEHPDALYVPSDATFNSNRIAINTFALNARLPTMLAFRELVEVGGLMCYGPNYTSMFRRAAEYVDKILRGAKPADMPFEQPTKFDLVVNLKIAKVLGLMIPESFLLRADDVIE